MRSCAFLEHSSSSYERNLNKEMVRVNNDCTAWCSRHRQPIAEMRTALSSGRFELEAWFNPGRSHRPATGFLEERLRNIRKRSRRENSAGRKKDSQAMISILDIPAWFAYQADLVLPSLRVSMSMRLPESGQTVIGLLFPPTGPSNTGPAAQRFPPTGPSNTGPAAQRFPPTAIGPANTGPAAQGFTAAGPVGQRIATTDYARFVKLLTLLEEVKETQRVHSNMLNALLKQHNHESLPNVPEEAVFPLTTTEEVEAMNEKLLDPRFMSSVVAMVADVGGSSLDDATRRMMRFLISNEVAIQYSLFGRHGKKRFRDLRLFEVIYGGLKKNSLTKEVNQKQAEKALTKWFTEAKDRGGNRAIRGQQEKRPSQNIKTNLCLLPPESSSMALRKTGGGGWGNDEGRWDEKVFRIQGAVK
ncbi:uncharacterized protein LOC130080162 [Rhinichthys klamathensis goyatoka]|uniref:uncharacterized protein LOC130080162 n=1 Tax=Rhinichthys klamathensis goyatoka TaxID=3034132 RepID=UPI0024B5E824|nr:uncharacterized protein LOC130080162 [Rhinichthys klamathensis goyatoka]